MKYDNDEIIHQKVGNIEYLQFRELLQYSNILHFYPLKHGGNSNEEYSSLNFGMFTNDNINVVEKNYKDVCRLFNLKYNNLFIPKQIHSDIVKIITDCDNISFIECDGSMTDKKDIVLVSNSADCMNVILFDRRNNAIGNIHAGWKGVLNNICLMGIKKMISEYGSNVKDIIVCIWPSICKKCFEVKQDVVQMFKDKFEFIDVFIEQSIDNRFLIDLSGIQKKNLVEIGIRESDIHISNICTKCNKDDFYSYRENNVTGRHASFITLREGEN